MMPLIATGRVRPAKTWWAPQDRRAFVVRGTAGSSIALVVALALGFSTPVVADELEDLAQPEGADGGDFAHEASVIAKERPAFAMNTSSRVGRRTAAASTSRPHEA